jgi:hypothetical protein
MIHKKFDDVNKARRLSRYAGLLLSLLNEADSEIRIMRPETGTCQVSFSFNCQVPESLYDIWCDHVLAAACLEGDLNSKT